MKAHYKPNKPLWLRFWKLRRTDHVCPQCHSRYEGLGCLQCGWVAGTSVACCGTETMREGKAIA